MLERIRELYAAIPAGARRPAEPPEPPQTGERRLTVEGPGETTYLQVAYHAPAAMQADFFALAVLDSLLAGPSNLNMFGGGISNKTSRLYRALVDKRTGGRRWRRPASHDRPLPVHPADHRPPESRRRGLPGGV